MSGPNLGSVGLAAGFYDAAYAPGRTPPRYGPLYRLVARWETPRLAVVADLLQGGNRLLEVGCGDGDLLRRVRGRYRHVTACDVSLVQLGSALRGKPWLRDRLIGANVDYGLPYANESFDDVAAVALLAHVFDVEHALREFYRVLRPGGRCIVHVANLAYLPRRIQLLLGRQPWTSLGPGWDGGQLHTFTLPSLTALLEQVGFEVERVAGSGFLPWLRAPRRSLLSGDLILVARRR